MLASFLPSLPAPQTPEKPGSLGPTTPLPIAVPARLATPQGWRIERVPPQREPEWDPTKAMVIVGGQPVVLRSSDAWNKIDGVEKGRDGSILVHRASINDPHWDFQDFIWYRGEEKPINGAQIYLDRLNYAGSTIQETNAMGMPESAPEAHVVENGRERSLGWGSVREWAPDGTFVLEVPVGDDGQPTGTEFTTGAVTRILRAGKEWRIPDYGYLGRTKDGTLVLASGAISSSVCNGFISLSEKKTAEDRVLLWRGGRFVAHVALPAGWRVAGLASDGWVLARRVPEAKLRSLFLLRGRTAAEIATDMARMMRDDNDPTTQQERDWTAGVLRGGVLTPIAFPRPKGTERLLWRGGATVYGPRAFRFTAFWGADERTFRVAPR